MFTHPKKERKFFAFFQLVRAFQSFFTFLWLAGQKPAIQRPPLFWTCKQNNSKLVSKITMAVFKEQTWPELKKIDVEQNFASYLQVYPFL